VENYAGGLVPADAAVFHGSEIARLPDAEYVSGDNDDGQLLGKVSTMSIVVGVDGSAVSQQALAWAVAEGRLRGETVRAVLAWELPREFVAGTLFGTTADAGFRHDLAELQHGAERRLAELVATVGTGPGVEQQAVEGHPADVLVAQSRTADLLVVGSRGHGAVGSAFLGSVSRACSHHARCPVVIIRDPGHHASPVKAWQPDQVLARQDAENAETWEMLQRLGIREGSELPLEFVYESGGPAADRVLAEFLRNESGYKAEVDADGITGWTPPIALSPAALDGWTETMVRAGHEHGGCVFSGWTAALAAGPSRRLPDAEGRIAART